MSENYNRGNARLGRRPDLWQQEAAVAVRVRASIYDLLEGSVKTEEGTGSTIIPTFEL